MAPKDDKVVFPSITRMIARPNPEGHIDFKEERSPKGKSKRTTRDEPEDKPVEEVGTRDIAGIREQIFDNCRIALPIYLIDNDKDADAPGAFDLNLKIAILFDLKSSHKHPEYRAEVRWGDENKVFLEGRSGSTPRRALEVLLELAARVLGNLKDERKLHRMRGPVGRSEIAGFGAVATNPDANPAETFRE